jgi:lipoprotein-anchoring transpeptidase ErfK/SrfK
MSMPSTRGERRARRRNAGIALAIVVGVAVGGGLFILTSDDDAQPVASSAAESVPSTATTATTPAALPTGSSYIATVRHAEITVHDSPSGAVVRTFRNPWFINDDPSARVSLVFGVQEVATNGWIEVRLPTRPNGSTGWVRADDVALSTTRYRIVIELSARRLRAFEGATVLLEDTVAIGAPDTPTPTGDYYIVALLKAPNPNTVYGPYAYGLSGHSDVLESFAGGDAEVGIHGNNDADVLGKDVSHGCVRMSNDGITRLAGLLPLGAPVSIVA